MLRGVMASHRDTPRGSDDPDRPVEDGMHPPTVPQLVECIHCGEEFDSWRMEWRVDDDGHGFWRCPTAGCDGAGFGIDIYPVDFDDEGRWTDPDGREIHESDLDDDEEEDEGVYVDESGEVWTDADILDGTGTPHSPPPANLDDFDVPDPDDGDPPF